MAFYLEQRSRRGTIATIRQYSEIIVRRVLDLPCNEFVTIGNKNMDNINLMEQEYFKRIRKEK